MASFEYRQAEEVREAFNSNGVRYLFLGTGAILLGFPDTTQDADVFLEKSPENGRACTAAIRSLGFDLTEGQAQEIERGKDFIQLKKGPFDLDLIFAPDGIERFEDAWRRRIDVEGFKFAISTTLLQAKKRAADQRIANLASTSAIP
jgi:hypothetical protein